MLRLRVGVSVLAALLLAGGWLLGDDPKKGDTPPPRVKGMLPQNYKKLGLTDQQTQEIYRIRGRYGAKIDALKQQIAELQEEERAEAEKVLTDAQKARLKELRLGDTKVKDKDTKEGPTDKPTDKTADKDKTGGKQ
jgi:hypothetical protein